MRLKTSLLQEPKHILSTILATFACIYATGLLELMLNHTHFKYFYYSFPGYHLLTNCYKPVTFYFMFYR